MQKVEKATFEGIGTTWNIEASIDSRIDFFHLMEKVKERIDLFDKYYSRFRTDSWVYSVFKNPGKHRVPEDFGELFKVYTTLYKKTNGLLTPTIGNLLRDAGYDEKYSLKPKKLTKPPILDTVISFDGTFLTTHIPVMLDFGAAGKGYIIDIVSEILKKEHVSHFCVDAGGDIYYYSKNNKPLSVGLENPENTSQVIGVASISNQAICGSAGNRRKWAQFHHIINPLTQKSPQEVIAVWVTADTTIIADAVATALFLAPEVHVTQTFLCDYLILFKDFSIQKSKGFPAELFTSSV